MRLVIIVNSANAGPSVRDAESPEAVDNAHGEDRTWRCGSTCQDCIQELVDRSKQFLGRFDCRADPGLWRQSRGALPRIASIFTTATVPGRSPASLPLLLAGRTFVMLWPGYNSYLVVSAEGADESWGCAQLRPPFMDMSMSSEELLAHEEAAEAGEMQLHTTFMFVIVSSCSLVLIFYFMSAMSILITVLFSFISSLALGALVYPYVDRYTDHRFSREVDIP